MRKDFLKYDNLEKLRSGGPIYNFNCGVCGAALPGMGGVCHQCGSEERKVSGHKPFVWTYIFWSICFGLGWLFLVKLPVLLALFY